MILTRDEPRAPGIKAGQAALDAIMDTLGPAATADEIAHACAAMIVRQIQKPKKAKTLMRHWLRWRPLLDYIARAERPDLFALVTIEFAEVLSAHPTIRAGRLPAIMEMERDDVADEK